MYLVVDGLIGSGKTTFLKKLQETTNFNIVFEPVWEVELNNFRFENF